VDSAAGGDVVFVLDQIGVMATSRRMAAWGYPHTKLYGKVNRPTKDAEPALRKELEDGLERTRRLVRGFLADFLVIPRERVSLAAVDAEGLDEDIAGLCAPLSRVECE